MALALGLNEAGYPRENVEAARLCISSLVITMTRTYVSVVQIIIAKSLCMAESKELQGIGIELGYRPDVLKVSLQIYATVENKNTIRTPW
jgi:hypothetical protein